MLPTGIMNAIFRTCLVALLATTGLAKDITFKELLTGSVAPLKLQLKDLDGTWRRCNVTGAGDSATGAVNATYAALLGMGGRNAYYTKGETVTVEGESFLVAYRISTPPIDFQALIRGGMAGRNPPPAPEKPTPESALSLALLHVRTLDKIGRAHV